LVEQREREPGAGQRLAVRVEANDGVRIDVLARGPDHGAAHADLSLLDDVAGAAARQLGMTRDEQEVEAHGRSRQSTAAGRPVASEPETARVVPGRRILAEVVGEDRVDLAVALA